MLFFGIHRFAAITEKSLMRSLSNFNEVRVLSHTWTSEDEVRAPWIDPAKIAITPPQTFRTLWPNSLISIDDPSDVIDEGGFADLENFTSYPGYSSRRGVIRMITSIGKVCEMALQEGVESGDLTVLTRTDLLTFEPLPVFDEDQLTGSVIYPNLRRNGQFCDWIMIVDAGALKALSQLPNEFKEIVRECRSFAGEDVLRSQLERHGLKLRPFTWSGILVRDKDLVNVNFGKLPKISPYRLRRLRQSLHFAVQNILDFISSFFLEERLEKFLKTRKPL